MRAVCAAAAFAAGLLAGGCERHAPATHDHYPALGTLVEVSVRGVDRGAEAEVFRMLRDGFAHAEREWHAWNDGALARYNAARTSGLDPEPPPELAHLLARANDMYSRSGGLFDPDIGVLIDAWGFHEPAQAGGPPPDEAIADWLRGPDGRRNAPRVDLGGIAKGAAVADARATLDRLGVRHALLNAGGDVAVLGDAGGRPWRVGIRHPRAVGVLAGIELAPGEVIFTSGDYERAYEHDGVRYHHLLDPRTGHPARGTASFTVVHTDPVVADAATTALFIAGDDWPDVAARMGVAYAMRVRDDGAVEASAGMHIRLRFEVAAPDVTVIDDPIARR